MDKKAIIAMPLFLAIMARKFLPVLLIMGCLRFQPKGLNNPCANDLEQRKIIDYNRVADV